MFEDWIAAFADADPLSAGLAAFEILVLAFFFYQIIRVMRGSRAAPIGIGLAIAAGAYFLSARLGLRTIHAALDVFAPYFVVGVIVIFQNEIRVALRDLALQLLPGRKAARKVHYQYEDVVFAIQQLAAKRVGALIVIERETGLKPFVQSGVALDARLSSDFLVSIFQRASPLHDGGVIIQQGRVAAAACFLPLTTNPGLVATLGTRHRAAIGVTEESDAIALVVSETDGKISVAFGGDIERGVSVDRLRLRMNQYLGPVVSPPRTMAPDVVPSPIAPHPPIAPSEPGAAKPNPPSDSIQPSQSVKPSQSSVETTEVN